MSASPTTENSASHELTTVASIQARYALQGPHATAVVKLPVPGVVGNDLKVRWSAIEADLRALGASPRSIEHMDDLLKSTHRRGHSLLLTANEDDAACCWLGFELDPSIRIGTLPALLPALHQAAVAPAPMIGAVIDRTGAELYEAGAFDIEPIATVEGDDEHIHKAAAGGWSQARHQRHSEVIWERNAALFATQIATEVGRRTAAGIVLTGDDREVRLVEARLSDRGVGPVLRTQVGGRHEPQTPDRVRDAVLDFEADLQRNRTARALDDLREELGQQDQAIAGPIDVMEAITENRVKTLFIDLVIGGRAPQVDALVRAALAHGAELVTGHDFGVRDGIAATLRMPYT